MRCELPHLPASKYAEINQPLEPIITGFADMIYSHEIFTPPIPVQSGLMERPNNASFPVPRCQAAKGQHLLPPVWKTLGGRGRPGGEDGGVRGSEEGGVINGQSAAGSAALCLLCSQNEQRFVQVM